MRTACLSLLTAVALAAPATASAVERTVAIPSPGPGPAKTDKVFVTKIGPARAKTVLLLVPGFYGGAGDFTLVGRDIVKRVPGLQVWAFDRRSQALEDTSVFDAARAGRVSVKSAFDYYLGWITDPSIKRHFQPLDQSRYGYARRWGLSMALNDVRRAVLLARRQGKRVLLGGHSLGASTATLYAAWDFGGRPGYKDVDGLVLIDGGTLGSFTTPSLKRTKQAMAELRKGDPFVDLLGIGMPWAAGVFAQVGALAAYREPTAPSLLSSFPLLPAEFRPPVPPTNRGGLGYAFDKDTSPAALSLIRVNAGHLGADGDWVDGDVTPIRRLADAFSGAPNATEWYFPRRLSIDVDAAQYLQRNAQTKLLGLRPWHLRAVDVPVYAYQTDLTSGRVLRGARRFVQRSRSPRRLARFVDGSKTDSHLDPLLAAPARSKFLKTVVPWLRGLSPERVTARASGR
jgi:pimeloyl-ACP methyl ester carboxylesterase